MKSNALNLRKTILKMIYKSKSSHIAVSFSVVEILCSIFDNVKIEKIKNQSDDRDRLIVSKGHSAASVYAILNQYGLITDDEIDTYCNNNSIFSGHVSHFVPYVEHSTGALGHGLPVAVGICIGLLAKGHKSSKVYVVLGDGELNEGSNWEAIMLAGNLKLSNLIVLIDKNNLGGVGNNLDNYCSIDPLDQKFQSFNFYVKTIDGHDVEQISSLIAEKPTQDSPRAIICNTVKGKGVSFMENNNVWHYRPPNNEEYKEALKEIEKGF